MKLVKDLLYTRNNRSLDIARVTCLTGGLTLFGLTIAKFVMTREFSPIEFGTAFAAFAGGAAGWMHFRDKDQPSPLAKEPEQ